MLDSQTIAGDFPLLSRRGPQGDPVIYLDSAATALKPQCVIDAVTDALTLRTANIHRSVHTLGDEATQAYEDSRDIAAAFINAEPNEIVFVRNTTEAINLVARSCYGQHGVVTSAAEHHSNYLPWGSDTVYLPLDSHAQVLLQALEAALAAKPCSLVALSQVSNVTGSLNPIRRIADMAHHYGAKLLVDAAQSAPHMPIDVTELGCDFLAFSGHKLGAPTGVGVLFGRAEWLEEMDYFLKGGSTIEELGPDGAVAKNAPWKFEAGTPAIESVIGLGAALSYLLEIGMEDVQAHFERLSLHARDVIASRMSLDQVLGDKAFYAGGPYSLVIPGMSPHLIARGLSDRYGIFVRSGFHCAQPLHHALQASASVRLSYWIYNQASDIDRAVDAMCSLIELVER